MNKPRHALNLCIVVLACLILPGCTRDAKRDRHIKKAEKYFQARDFQNAELETLNALRLDSKNLRALSLLEKLYFEQGSIIKAAPVLSAIETLDATNTAARLKLARIYQAFQDTEKARERAKAVLEKDATNVDAMLILAESAATEEETQEVRDRIAKWPKTSAGDYHIVQAMLLMKSGDLAAAEVELQQTINADSKSKDAGPFLAWIAWARGDFKRADELFKAAGALSGDRPLEGLRWALLKMRSGDLTEAQKILEPIAQRHPEFLPAQTQLAVIAFEQKRFDECEKLVTGIIAHDRSLYQPLQLQARLKLLRGDNDGAIKDLERLPSRFQNNPQTQFYLAVGYLQKRDLPEARRNLEAAIAMDKSFAEAVVLLADLDLRSGKATNAMASLGRLLQQRPANINARLLLADAYRATGSLDEAAQEYRRVVEKEPKSLPARFFLGATYRQQMKTNEARAVFESILLDAPENFAVVNQLVEMDLQARNLQSASNRLANVLARSPSAAEAHFVMAKVHIAGTNVALAESSLTKAIELQPDFMAAYGALIGLYSATKREDQALSKMDQVLSKHPNNVQVLMQQALLLEKMKQPAKAIAAYQRILDINTNFVSAFNNIAYLLAENGGDLDKALQMAQRAVQLGKNAAPLRDTLGWVLFKRGDTFAAAEVLKESAAGLGENAEAQFHCGMACFSSGQRDTAREAFARALKLQSDFPGKEQAQKRLEIMSLGDVPVDSEVIAKLEDFRKQQPQEVGVLLLLGESYRRVNDTNKAMDACRQALQKDSNSVPAMLALSEMMVRNSADTEQALQLSKAAYPLTQNDPKARHAFARVALAADAHAWALRLFQEAAQKANQPDMEYDLALCQFWSGDTSTAETTTRRALSHEQEFFRSAEARKFLDVLAAYRSRSTARDDLRIAESALKTASDWPPALLLYARAQERSGVSNEARRLYQKLVNSRPFLVPAAVEYARFLSENSPDRDKATALALLEKAQKIAPLGPIATATYGQLLYVNGNYTNAIKTLKQSISAGSAGADSYFYLGFAYDRVGDRQQGRRTLNDALALKSDHQLAASAREVLERYNAESKLPTGNPLKQF